MAKSKDEKEEVQIEPEEETPDHVTQSPYGQQDMNLPVEPLPYEDGIGAPVERRLTDEVHVDMGRGALTFKPGDTITIEDGAITKVVTSDGMEMEFKSANIIAKERFDKQQEAMGKNTEAGQAPDDQDAPSQPPDKPEPVGPLPDLEDETEKKESKESKPAAKKDDDEDDQPRASSGKFAPKKDD